ncbi:UvrD-helicase domain-containing protein [Thermoactinomyces mirandus]|uniref:DNA 3'-5' helicase n=1 Tax=Thermoactinomyces mirandus TaxID=2756294 RepID=A0A7W2ATC1_9BACL|nr:UvrD-helicase domain-containing protein [Thermoactinomyces mirandus]MBA4603336.1 UvrD-helicase domain-containing protein [Thermoactinomyces mirandus]
MELSSEQKEIINSDERFILIKAGAGAGKTEVLVQRVLRLLEKDPTLTITDFAIITFTNNSTEEMKNRLQGTLYKKLNVLQDDQIKKRLWYELELINTAQISTIHKFCHTVLNLAGPFRLENNSYSPKAKISSSQLSKSVDKVMSDWIKKQNGQTHPLIRMMPVFLIKKYLKMLYESVRSKGTDIQQVYEKTMKSWALSNPDERGQIKKALAELLYLLEKEYEERKVLNIDVDDLLELTYKAITNIPDVKKKIANRFRYIFVDEFQDTSYYQAKIFQMICSEETGPSLFVVGDIKQSIYQFRGADLQSYDLFEKWMKERGKVYHLFTNYRSSLGIVKFVNRLFKEIQSMNEPKFLFEPLQSGKNEDHSGECVHFINTNQENEKEIVISFLKTVEETEYPRYAILCRTNSVLHDYEKALTKAGIPLKIKEGGGFFQREEIINISRILNWLTTSNNLVKKEEVLSINWFQHNHHKLQQVEKDLRKVIYHYSVAQILEEIYKHPALNLRGYCKYHGLLQARANLEKLKEMIRFRFSGEKISLIDYLQWLDNQILHNTNEPQATVNDNGQAVLLTTIHSAKGLEYDYVILVDLDRKLESEHLYPKILVDDESGIEFKFNEYTNPQIIKASDHYDSALERYKEDYLAEEARILYVALTRAKQKLYLLGNWNEDLKNNKNRYSKWLRIVKSDK